uniref:Elongation of fatty acids protein 3-like n=1 Tax=Tanacetum cinerariifolium TaxID=118510 RepID=A0A6L2N9S2_TANCI|nr:elongation of fatty acids protein 3-like [Tanacetum cinerariifolium]
MYVVKALAVGIASSAVATGFVLGANSPRISVGVDLVLSAAGNASNGFVVKFITAFKVWPSWFGFFLPKWYWKMYLRPSVCDSMVGTWYVSLSSIELTTESQSGRKCGVEVTEEYGGFAFVLVAECRMVVARAGTGERGVKRVVEESIELIGVLMLHVKKGGCNGIGAWGINSVLNAAILLLFINFYVNSHLRGRRKLTALTSDHRDNVVPDTVESDGIGCTPKDKDI